MVEAIFTLDGQELQDVLRLDGRNTQYKMIMNAENYRKENGYDGFRIVVNNPVTFNTIYRTEK